MDKAHKERELAQGETPTININSGGIAFIGDIAGLNYCSTGSTEVKEDMEKANEKVSKVNQKVEKVQDDVGKVRDDIGKIQVDLEKLKDTGFVGTMQTQGHGIISMALSNEKENFVKIARIVLDVVPHYLRKLFITKWEEKYPNEKWQSNNTSGDALVAKIAKVNNNYAEKLKAGDEQQWDTTILVYVFLYSGLNMIDHCHNPKETRVPPLRISEEIDIIRDTRNEFFGHATQMSCPSHDFSAIVDKLKGVAKNIFGADAEKEVDDIRKVPINTQSTANLRQRLNDEKNRNDQFNQSLKEMKEEVKEAKDEVKQIREAVEKKFEEIQQQLKGASSVNPQPSTQEDIEPYTEKDIDDMKAKYKIKHQKHEIHKVDSNGRIVLEEVDVEEFAVKLRMSEQMPAMETLRGEADRYFEQLEGKRGCYIEIPQLIDKKKRITFVTAIAGSGKSVLVKQMTYKWANGELFNEFKVCMTFECRELNDFASNEGSGLETHKMIVEFLKYKFGFYVKDSKNTLFIADGLDELYDSNESDSIIGQLLDLKKSKYQESKIIITGRPHIESMLKKHGGGNMGGLRKVEIIGLSNEQIDEYIQKFASSDEEVAKIKKVKDSSKSNLKLYHVPQFLNSICCVALLSDETEIKNAAELYCWSCYLLFRQHADKEQSHDTKVPEIFNEYSKLLLVLSKICHELLNKNSLIFEGNIELKFDKIEKGKDFLSSLFVDVSNDFKERKQFKHLTLMEFLSAVYVCTTKEHDEIIKDILKKRSYQVLLFYCQLMSGLMYKGIIKNLFTNALKLEESDAKSFFCNILKLVRKYVGSDFNESFQLSIDVIMCLMNKDGISKQFILSIVNQLSFKRGNRSKISSRRKWIEMMKPLTVEFECDDIQLKKAIRNVHFGWFEVSALNELKFAKYLASFYLIILDGDIAKITTTVRDICKEIDEINEWVKVKRVCIWKCKLDDKNIDDKITKSSKLELLQIGNCCVTEQGFFNLCKWIITVEEFGLTNIKEMKVEWWNVLVEVIVNAKKKNNGDLLLKELWIRRCPLMNDEIKEKILQCGITLEIDRTVMHPPQPPRNRRCTLV